MLQIKCPKFFLVIVAVLGVSSSLVANAETVSEENLHMPKWLIVHAGMVLPVPGKPPRRNATIVVRDGRIVEIRDGQIDATQIVTDASSADVETLQLLDKFVLPGLMDMHVHLSFEFGVDGQQNHGASEEYAREHRSSMDDVYNFVTAQDNARKTLMAGYTTVRNVGSDGWHIFALRDAINDGNIVGPRILTSGYTIHAGADSGPGACTGVESCRRAVRAQIDMGADLIKVYGTCSGSKPCGYETAPAVFLEDELRAIIETAATRELKVAVHAHGTAAINLVASLGVASIEHGSFNDAESRRIMKKNSVYLVPTLSVHDNIKKDIVGAKEPMLGIMQNFRDKHGPGMLAAHKAGVKIASGSDAGVSQHGNNAHELEYYVEYGLTAEEAIVAATVNAADLIGMGDELGTLEPGKYADLIAVDENPLENISALMDVAVVVKGGQIVKAPK
ncbi:MAG TPA: amidohydrolase family protein [Woeseiaceae bacterium]|nr:amidohydrolase family protein [Woeseiaceae bacterium]